MNSLSALSFRVAKMNSQVDGISKDFTIKVVRDIEEFKNLKEVWDKIVLKNGVYVPWLCWDWFNLCLKYFKSQSELLLMLLCRGDEIVSIAPFIMQREKFKKFDNIRRIELLGNPYSPIKDFICNGLDNSETRVYINAFLNYFSSEFRDWDIIELDSLPDEMPTLQHLRMVIPKTGLKFREYSSFGDWYLDRINYSGEEYLNNRSKNIRLEIRRRRRRLEELGHLEFQVRDGKEKLDHYMGLYQEVRSKSWKSPEANLAFQKEFRQIAVNRGWLRFSFLLLDGSPIAAQIRLVSNNIAYFLSTTYDSKYSKYSPGLILLAEMIKYLIDVDRVKEIDNLRGDETYKREWTPNRRERSGMLIFNSSLKGEVLAFLMNKYFMLLHKIFLKKARIIS